MSEHQELAIALAKFTITLEHLAAADTQPKRSKLAQRAGKELKGVLDHHALYIAKEVNKHLDRQEMGGMV